MVKMKRTTVCLTLLLLLAVMLFGCSSGSGGEPSPSQADAPAEIALSVDASGGQYWYLSGQEINPAGLVITATLSDGTTRQVSPEECTFQKPPFFPFGEKEVQVSLGGVSTSFPIWTCPNVSETEDYIIYEIRENENGSRVSLLPVLVGEDKPFLLVLPGGGYAACQPQGNEGYAYAARAKELGYNAFVLQYSTNVSHPAPLEDVNLALDIIEDMKDVLHVSMENYAVIGSSAGGHLAGCWCTKEIGYEHYGKPRPAAAILTYPVTKVSDRADETGMIIIPEDADEATLDQLDFYRHIGPDYPPTYSWIFREDSLLPNVEILEEALNEQGVEHMIRYFSGGMHGLGQAIGTEAEGWLDEALHFWIDHIS